MSVHARKGDRARRCVFAYVREAAAVDVANDDTRRSHHEAGRRARRADGACVYGMDDGPE